MKTSLKNVLNKLYISYDPYTDLFQMYDDQFFKLPKNQLLEKSFNNMRFVFTRGSNEPLLIEIDHAYDRFGVEFQNLKKHKIINIVEPLVQEYFKN